MVRDASGLLNDTLSLTSSNDCVGLACHYGWDFTECISNKSCSFGISNYYQVSSQWETSLFYLAVVVATHKVIFKMASGQYNEHVTKFTWGIQTKVKDIPILCQMQTLTKTTVAVGSHD